MTISQGGLIQAADYNNLQATVAKILGTTYDSAAPDYNYGLTTQINSSQISISPTPKTITASDWTKLQLDILAAAAHQGTTSLISALVSQTISQSATILASDQTNFINAVNIIQTNRTTAATRSAYDPGLTNYRDASWGSNTKTTITHTFTLTWATAAEARYFFNLGSIIQFSASQSGGTPSWKQNANWANALSAMGTINYGVGGCFGNSAGTPSLNVGWYNLTDTNKQIFTKGGIADNTLTNPNTYINNDYTISAKCNVASNSTGTANSITFTIDFNDDSKNATSSYDYLDGRFTSTVSISKGTITDSSTLYTAPQPTATQGTLLTA